MRKWTVEEYESRIMQHEAIIKGKDIMERSVADLIEHEKIVTQSGYINGMPEPMNVIHENALLTLDCMIKAYNMAQELRRSKGYGSTKD